MSLPCSKVLTVLPYFVEYLNDKISQLFKDMKEYYDLKFNGENSLDTFIKDKSEYDIYVCKELEEAYQEYKGIHIHEAPRFFYVTLKIISPKHQDRINRYSCRKLNIIKKQDPFLWIEDESIICLVAKNDYNTNAKLGEIFAGDIMDISTGTRDYEAGYNKNPAKIARGNILNPSTLRNIRNSTRYGGIIELRPIDAISLRPKNYINYNDGFDHWKERIEHLQKHKKVD
jgi:hypothetical protein